MSTRTKKATPRPGFRLPPALKTSLLPACLAVFGVTAWGDIPLPSSWRPWVAIAQQARRGEAPDPRPMEETRLALTEEAPPHFWHEEVPSVEPREEASAEQLALPHTHGRRVDHLARARTLKELGDISGALTECRRALHDDPADTDALALAARLARLGGQTEVAVLAYEQLGRLLPEDTDALVHQARLLVSLGRYPEAVRVGEEALVRDPEDAEAYQVLGRAHLSAGELPAAILRFQQAVHLDPEHGYALNNLGFAYLRAGEDAKAADVLSRAASLLPHVAYVHNNLGVAWERLGRVEDARAAYATATRLSPRYVQARVNADRVNRLARVGVPLAGARDAAPVAPAP
ncbi:tetratricopeptide repeat protein [Pyxidicoccus fallax]|uniref:Tetratricopeptide repeat protein n=1 Tax=Pyxidicoccus fallax TaxID=394095 RepID=A0A848LU68_9BACT|nr:tetratricopeptide repeat protein [Pyxidicoccus fallax]NMO21219.1 tetratricopeptide repeat protein [Pyxidicoccus fallax]NPC82341.1 tetratricopeptide repeat protein [Pyxidicoccus fallax]